MDVNTELRKLSPGNLFKLVQILEYDESWKRLMAIIPKTLTLDNFESRIAINNLPKYNTDHFKLIENAGCKQKKCCSEILFEEWGTSGRIRPRIGHLLRLLERAELFRAADYVAVDLLKIAPPERPVNGPAAKVDITLHELSESSHSNEEIERILDQLNYPSSIINASTYTESNNNDNINRNSESSKRIIPKIIVDDVSNTENQVNQINKSPEPTRSNNASDSSEASLVWREVQLEKKIEKLRYSPQLAENITESTTIDPCSSVSDMIKFSSSSADSNNQIPAFTSLLHSQNSTSSNSSSNNIPLSSNCPQNEIPAISSLLNGENYGRTAQNYKLTSVSDEMRSQIPALSSLLNTEEDFAPGDKVSSIQKSNREIPAFSSLLLNSGDFSAGKFAAENSGNNIKMRVSSGESNKEIPALSSLLNSGDSSTGKFSAENPGDKIKMRVSPGESDRQIPALSSLLQTEDISVARSNVENFAFPEGSQGEIPALSSLLNSEGTSGDKNVRKNSFGGSNSSQYNSGELNETYNYAVPHWGVPSNQGQEGKNSYTGVNSGALPAFNQLTTDTEGGGMPHLSALLGTSSVGPPEILVSNSNASNFNVSNSNFYFQSPEKLTGSKNSPGFDQLKTGAERRGEEMPHLSALLGSSTVGSPGILAPNSNALNSNVSNVSKPFQFQSLEKLTGSFEMAEHRKNSLSPVNSTSRTCASPLPNLSLNTILPHFTYFELEQTTDGFDETLLSDFSCSEGEKKEPHGRKLGSGAFGSVYLALGLLSKAVAVKKLNLNGVNVVNVDDTVTKQFRNEVELLYKYKHENLLALLGYSCDGTTYCLIYEYVSGGALKDRLQSTENRLIWTNRLYIALGTARAVSYLHNAYSVPLIHRDIKSSNILLDSANKPKLCDFGLIKLTPNQNTNTSTTVFGTSAYMAPEAFRGDVSVKLDTFSFGVVLLELLTGLPPLDEKREGNDLVTHVEDVCEDDIKPLLDIKAGTWMLNNQHFGDLLYVIACKCLEEKKKRPVMAEVVKMLSQLIDETM